MLLPHQHIVKHNVADAQYLIFDMGIPAESTPGMESQMALQLTYPVYMFKSYQVVRTPFLALPHP